MHVRSYRDGDAHILVQLFFRSVRELARAKYTEEQLQAWAPSVPDPAGWDTRMRKNETLIAEIDEMPVAFLEFTRDGHLVMLYRNPDCIGGTTTDTLYRAAEQRARILGIPRLRTEASLLAEPFFARHGYRLEERENVERNGVFLPRARMSKTLDS